MTLELSCDIDGVCGVCKVLAPDSDVLQCEVCSCLWHMNCLRQQPLSSASWTCPDCDPRNAAQDCSVVAEASGLVHKIRQIEADCSLTDAEKARLRQDLVSNAAVPVATSTAAGNEDDFVCLYCRDHLDRPVTTPCGHNFCLKCLQKWFALGKKECGKCRSPFNRKFIEQPRINSALVHALRLVKTDGVTQSKPIQFIHNDDRPEKCFVTERAKRKGKANAASGKFFVTVANDHFGPIPAENDPTRNQGVLVGESWADRMDCRQWGTHRPHVAGISGQTVGAQSVALSGGYKDDEDHGEWFLYTGSGGRDLSGNKRTSSKQSSDQVFMKLNKSLVTSCLNGYPVRVVRSHKEKNSSYAPQTGVRYDGIYRIEKCWRKVGIQKFRVCRYLFVRCDNEPAPWTTDTFGDRPRPLPDVPELKKATDIKERKGLPPAWDWKEDEGVWGWIRPPPISRQTPGPKGKRRLKSMENQLISKFGCGICRKVMEQSVSTPCGHQFCKSCLVNKFSGQADERDRGGRRALRIQKNIKRCPGCAADITEFMTNPAVNTDMDELIQSLKSSIENRREHEQPNDEGGEEDEEGGDEEGEEGDGEDEEEGEEGDDEQGDDEDVVDLMETSEKFTEQNGAGLATSAEATQTEPPITELEKHAVVLSGSESQPEAAATPQPEAAATPQPEAAATPQPEAAATPQPATRRRRKVSGLVMSAEAIQEKHAAASLAESDSQPKASTRPQTRRRRKVTSFSEQMKQAPSPATRSTRKASVEQTKQEAEIPETEQQDGSQLRGKRKVSEETGQELAELRDEEAAEPVFTPPKLRGKKRSRGVDASAARDDDQAAAGSPSSSSVLKRRKYYLRNSSSKKPSSSCTPIEIIVLD